MVRFYSKLAGFRELHTVSVLSVWADGQESRNFGICDRAENVTVDLKTPDK
jgi:hypothetical protein